MAYRDEDEAMRARLAVMEDRLRRLEEEVESLRRRPQSHAPTVKVPVIDGESKSTAGGLVRLVGTLLGALWFASWLAYYVAALFGVHDGSEVIRLTMAATLLGFLPGGVTFYFAMRAPPVYYREESVRAPLTRIGELDGRARVATAEPRVAQEPDGSSASTSTASVISASDRRG